MRTGRRWSIAAFLAATAFAGACLSPVKNPAGDSLADSDGRRFLTQAVVDTWARESALAARRLIDSYGVPDEVRSDHLAWNHHGPWRKTVVRDLTPAYGHPEDLPLVRQTIAYEMTGADADALARFDDRLSFDAAAGELSVTSDREEVNFLRMNLADGIVRRALSPAQAREIYAQTLTLEASGKSSPYLSGLIFVPEL
jgi:hypothetical protein